MSGKKFSDHLRSSLRSFLKVPECRDGEIAGLRMKLEALEKKQNSEVIDLRIDLVSLRNEKRKALDGSGTEIEIERETGDKIPPVREKYLTIFSYLMSIFLLTGFVGSIIFWREGRLAFYLAYLLPIVAAIVAGLGIYFSGEDSRSNGLPAFIKDKPEAFCYKASMFILMGGLAAFVITENKGASMLAALFFPPGLASALFFCGLRQEKWKRPPKGIRFNRAGWIFSWALLIVSTCGFLWWCHLIYRDGTCEVEKIFSGIWKYVVTVSAGLVGA